MQRLVEEEVYGNLCWRGKTVASAYKYGEISRIVTALLYSTVRDLFVAFGLEWGAAQRRSKGIPLFDTFKKEPCVSCMTTSS